MTSIAQRTITEKETLDIIEDEYEKGNVDQGGGVPAHRVADRVGIHHASVQNHVQPLIDDGKVEWVWGLAHDTNRPRRSYVPVEGDR